MRPHKHTIPYCMQSRHSVQWHHGIIVKSDVQVVSVQCTLSGGWSPGLLVSAPGVGHKPPNPAGQARRVYLLDFRLHHVSQ